MVVTTKHGGYGTTEIKCLGCPYTTGALGSKKDAWKAFRLHYEDQTTTVDQPATTQEARML